MHAEDYEVWARKALVELVLHVRDFEGGPVSIAYSELAARIGYPEPHTGNLFGARIGRVLGRFGDLIKGELVDGFRPPMIQALVVSKRQRMPGPGLKAYIPGYDSLTK